MCAGGRQCCWIWLHALGWASCHLVDSMKCDGPPLHFVQCTKWQCDRGTGLQGAGGACDWQAASLCRVMHSHIASCCMQVPCVHSHTHDAVASLACSFEINKDRSSGLSSDLCSAADCQLCASAQQRHQLEAADGVPCLGHATASPSLVWRLQVLCSLPCVAQDPSLSWTGCAGRYRLPHVFMPGMT